MDDHTFLRLPANLTTANISFNNETGTVGTLFFGPPMRFEGNAEDSARIFFREVMRLADGVDIAVLMTAKTE